MVARDDSKPVAPGRALNGTTTDDIGRRIIEASAELIVAQGFGGATTDAIARAAKTSKRSIYERFPDRDALFEHVMAWLCSQAGDRPDGGGEVARTGDKPLLVDMIDWGYGVLLRFSRPRARRVLVAAVAAKASFPDALRIFWQCGPGVAESAIAEQLAVARAEGDLARIDPATAARDFILECCGPLVLDQLFDDREAPTDAELKARVEATATRMLGEWRQR